MNFNQSKIAAGIYYSEENLLSFTFWLGVIYSDI